MASVSHVKGRDELKRWLLPLTLGMILGCTALSTTNAWGAEAQHVYNWGNPWSSKGFGLQYYGPSSVAGVPGQIVQISTSNSASYALTNTGQVWAWGVGQGGGLGDGTTRKSAIRPVRVNFPQGVKITSLPSPMPFDTGLAIDSNHNIWGWGSNVEHSLCLGTTTPVRPTKLPFTDVTRASGAGGHALYLSDGKLYACGGNEAGELGNGITVSSSQPVRVTGLPDETIRSIGSSWENSGALMADGSYYDWGYNQADQLGNGTTTNSDTPVRVALPAKVQQVSLGGSSGENGQTVAMLDDGSVWTWGQNRFGQLGIGKASSSSGPTKLDLAHSIAFVQVVSGGSTMYGVDNSGAVWAWGQNNAGQLGFGAAALGDLPMKVGISLTCISSTAANVEGLRESGATSSEHHTLPRLVGTGTQCTLQ